MAWRATIVAPQLEPEIIEIELNALVAANRYLIPRHRVPPLFESGVRYSAEPPPTEEWLTAPVAASLRLADCEDLACWRAAELQLAGEKARPVYKRQQVGGFGLWHIVVERGDGTVEDPSRILGMR